MHDSVDFADMGEEFISEPLSAGSPFYKSRNIDEFDDGGGDFFALIESGEFVESFVGNGYDADIRFYRTKGIIGTFRAGMCDCVEQSGFSHVGKSYDTEFHNFTVSLKSFRLIFLLYYNIKSENKQIKLAQNRKIC